MSCAVDIIHTGWNEILDNLRLIHNNLFMIYIFDELFVELSEFKEHSEYEFKKKKMHYVEKSNTKAMPLKELIKELFTPTDCDNQDSTEMLEKLAGLGIQALVNELEDKKKAT